MNCFFVFPSDTSGTGRLIIFLPTGLATGLGKEDAENTLFDMSERKIFRQQAQAILDRTERRQSNFAEKINGLAEWEYEESGCSPCKCSYKSTIRSSPAMKKIKATRRSLCRGKAGVTSCLFSVSLPVPQELPPFRRPGRT